MLDQILKLYGISHYTSTLHIQGTAIRAKVTTRNGKKYIVIADLFGGIASLYNGNGRHRGTIHFEVVPHPNFSYVKGRSNEPKPLGSVKF
jgi:hypothetical protein